MAWRDEAEDGVRELLNDGAGVVIEWRGYSIPALQGSGVSYDMIANGGMINSENPSFMVLKSDLERLAAGEMFEQGDGVTLAGKTVIVKNISFDPADPAVRIETGGENE